MGLVWCCSPHSFHVSLPLLVCIQGVQTMMSTLAVPDGPLRGVRCVF
jgi:hypothetical protein